MKTTIHTACYAVYGITYFYMFCICLLTYCLLMQCSRVLLEKLAGSQSRYFLHFIELKGVLLRLQEPATCPHPQSVQVLQSHSAFTLSLIFK